MTIDQIAGIYGFKKIFEPALQGLFANPPIAGMPVIKAFTANMVPSTGDVAQDLALVQAGYDVIVFQKDIPRVEIDFTPGAGQGQFAAHTIGGTEMPVETSWKGQFRLDCITRADAQIHEAYVVAVRFLMQTQLQSLNGNQLTKHRLQQFSMDAGTSPTFRPQEGTMRSVLLYDVDFSIQDDAWADLAQ